MEVSIRLHDKDDLWTRFHKLHNEMIVTKTGRKMFPKLEFTIEGLDPDAFYAVVLQMEQVDDHRYKFQDGEWSPAGRGEQATSSRAVSHHDCVMAGAKWMRSPIHFERLKITNNPQDSDPSHVFLHSMHKYIPVISVYQVHQPGPVPNFYMPMEKALPSQTQTEICRKKFPETEFITVTAYQNEKTKALKIRYNPYAKGFREGGDRKRSSPRSPPADLPAAEKVSTPELFPTNLLPTIQMPPLNPLFYNQLLNPNFFNPYILMNQYRVLQKPYPM